MKTKIILIGILLMATILPSCKKYSEGPSLSFRSREARVANTWIMEKVTLNGSDVTSSFANISYTETYDKDGNYSYSSSVGNGSGKWSFQSDDTQIKRQGVSGQSTVDLIILRLKERSFWYKFTDGNDTYEFHLIEK